MTPRQISLIWRPTIQVTGPYLSTRLEQETGGITTGRTKRSVHLCIGFGLFESYAYCEIGSGNFYPACQFAAR